MPRKFDPDRMTHPGRTSAERRALDAIGCGEPPRCSRKTLQALLDAELIVDVGSEQAVLDYIAENDLTLPEQYAEGSGHLARRRSATASTVDEGKRSDARGRGGLVRHHP